MVELVVFDWNGTLLADTQAMMDAGNLVIKTFGGKPLSRAEYSKAFDFPTMEFYCKQGSDQKSMIEGDYVGVFHNHYETRAKKCRTRRGARGVLKYLQGNSIKSVILSNHVNDAINEQLRRLDIKDYFHEVLGNRDKSLTATGRNKVQRIRDYLDINDVNSEKAIIIGDSTEDIEIGKELGMQTIGLTGGYFSTPRLRAHNPDYMINNLGELIGIINE